MKRNVVIGLLACAATFWMTSGHAAVAALNGAKVIRVLIADEGRFGGCMARLDRNISTVGLNCPGSWVSFSCTGDFTSKDVAYKMLETAQMAMALDRWVGVYVDDSRLHNGWCYANRIDMW